MHASNVLFYLSVWSVQVTSVQSIFFNTVFVWLLWNNGPVWIVTLSFAVKFIICLKYCVYCISFCFNVKSRFLGMKQHCGIIRWIAFYIFLMLQELHTNHMKDNDFVHPKFSYSIMCFNNNDYQKILSVL